MKIINEKYKNFTIAPQILEYDLPENVLFFDIETTGLNKKSTHLYLIGCGFYREGYLNTKFFFGESTNEEEGLLISFMDFAKNFKTIIHFNGTKFDLPYIEYKCKMYNLVNELTALNSLDLYKEIKPLRHLLFKESMRQKCVEDFLGIERNDKYDGGQLIPIYKTYTETHDEECYFDLMMHNREDVLGMHQLFPILDYLKLHTICINYIKHETSNYSDFYDETKTEVIFTYRFNIDLPKSFSVVLNNIYYKFDVVNKLLVIRTPAINGTAKHYYENYSDYYFIPSENICIHKSIASGVDKTLRIKATRDNCYTEVEGIFLPQFSVVYNNTCGFDYKTRNNYFPITCIDDDDSANKYGNHLVNTLLTTKPKKIKKCIEI